MLGRSVGALVESVAATAAPRTHMVEDSLSRYLGQCSFNEWGVGSVVALTAFGRG